MRKTLKLWFHAFLLALTVPVEWAGRAIDRIMNWPDWLANLRCMIARASFVRTVKLGERGYLLDIDREMVAAAPEAFTDEQQCYLRPVAETLAMLDGNAFFDMDQDHWQYGYMAEAWALFEANGGLDGWAGGASFAKPYRTTPPQRLVVRR